MGAGVSRVAFSGPPPYISRLINLVVPAVSTAPATRLFSVCCSVSN